MACQVRHGRRHTAGAALARQDLRHDGCAHGSRVVKVPGQTFTAGTICGGWVGDPAFGLLQAQLVIQRGRGLSCSTYLTSPHTYVVAAAHFRSLPRRGTHLCSVGQACTVPQAARMTPEGSASRWIWSLVAICSVRRYALAREETGIRHQCSRFCRHVPTDARPTRSHQAVTPGPPVPSGPANRLVLTQEETSDERTQARSGQPPLTARAASRGGERLDHQQPVERAPPCGTSPAESLVTAACASASGVTSSTGTDLLLIAQ